MMIVSFNYEKAKSQNTAGFGFDSSLTGISIPNFRNSDLFRDKISSGI